MKNYDFVAIGDITTDAFIRLDTNSAKLNKDASEICLGFGDKLPYEFVKEINSVGNSPNASVSASRLGLKTALISNLGDDLSGEKCVHQIKSEGIDIDFITKHQNAKTNYHYVLWFADDRTILVKHESYNYKLPTNWMAKWVYLSSIGSGTEKYHEEIAEYLNQNPEIKLTFQPGTFQIKLGVEKLKQIYQRTMVLVVNKSEAKKILQTENDDIKFLLSNLEDLGPKIILITDGVKGAYMKENENYWFMPIYPDLDKPYERTGAGDAFASTFTAFLALGKTPLEAFNRAPINSMSVVTKIGAQEGLLDLPQIEKYLEKASSEYTLKEL